MSRLFHDTIKGGDFRSREANVYRLAQLSANIIDQCVAQGVPFAREYGGSLANRSFGGAQVARTFYARGQTGQQLLLGAYQALQRQVALGRCRMLARREMLDLVVIDGAARGIVVRDLETGAITGHAAHAVLLATGGYANVFNLSTNAKGSNATAIWRAYQRGAAFANPCFTQIHPTCIPASGAAPGQADADERVAAQRRPRLGAARARRRPPRRAASPRTSATTSSSGATRRTATWCRATWPAAPPRRSATPAAASGRAATASTWISATRCARSGARPSTSATATCSRCTSASPTRIRARCRCASTRRRTTRWAGCGSTTGS